MPSCLKLIPYPIFKIFFLKFRSDINSRYTHVYILIKLLLVKKLPSYFDVEVKSFK